MELDPNNQFQCCFVSYYAYPLQIAPIFYRQADQLSMHLKSTGILQDTPFKRGIFVTLIPQREEEKNLRRWKVDEKNSCLWVTLRVSGDELWDAAENDQMEQEVRRIIIKILNLVFAKYKLDKGVIESW